MSTTKKIYSNPQPGKPLITTISSGCLTPLLEVKFGNLNKPFFYANSPKVPRYSITCIVDPVRHKDFLSNIQNIEQHEEVATILKSEIIREDGENIQSGKILMKFQSREKIPVFLGESLVKLGECTVMELEDELAAGEKIIVQYDILRYTKKGTVNTEHGISFKATRIYYYEPESIPDDTEQDDE